MGTWSAATNIPFPNTPLWVTVLVYAVIALPVSLWVGYAITRIFRAMDRSSGPRSGPS